MIGLPVAAQHNASDSINIWHAKSRGCERFVDSLRIITMSLDEDHVLLDKRMRDVVDSLNRWACQDIKMNIQNDPRIDSMNQKLAELNLVGMFLTERFDYRLVQIDSYLGVQYDLDKKIRNAGHKK